MLMAAGQQNALGLAAHSLGFASSLFIIRQSFDSLSSPRHCVALTVYATNFPTVIAFPFFCPSDLPRRSPAPIHVHTVLLKTNRTVLLENQSNPRSWERNSAQKPAMGGEMKRKRQCARRKNDRHGRENKDRTTKTRLLRHFQKTIATPKNIPVIHQIYTLEKRICSCRRRNYNTKQTNDNNEKRKIMTCTTGDYLLASRGAWNPKKRVEALPCFDWKFISLQTNHC